MSAKSAAPIVLNIPELASRPPLWADVQAAFLNNRTSPAIQTVLHFLIGVTAEARKLKEGNPKLSLEESKFFDGQASASDEVCHWILWLIRGEYDKLPKSVRAVFPKPDPSQESSEG